jgi:plastocyanin
LQRIGRTQTSLAVAVIALAVAGCSVKHPTDNLARGKQLFVAKCGACHTLSHAQSTGNIGPNLDAAFSQALHDGMKRNDIRGIVDFQIKYPNAYGGMPAMLFNGQCAGDVAGYVAAVAGAQGTDSGALATATQQTRPAECGLPSVTPVAQKPVTEQNGTLEIDADPTGQLKFLASSATAKPGPVTLRMLNKSSTPHNIAIEGGGLNLPPGTTVSGGGVSTVSVTLKPGTYTFFCAVPGHREAGMVGTVTVK